MFAAALCQWDLQPTAHPGLRETWGGVPAGEGAAERGGHVALRAVPALDPQQPLPRGQPQPAAGRRACAPQPAGAGSAAGAGECGGDRAPLVGATHVADSHWSNIVFLLALRSDSIMPRCSSSLKAPVTHDSNHESTAANPEMMGTGTGTPQPSGQF